MKVKVFGIPPAKGSKRTFDIYTIVCNDIKSDMRILTSTVNPFPKAPFACIAEYTPAPPDYMRGRKYNKVDEKTGEIVTAKSNTLYVDGKHFSDMDYDAIKEERAEEVKDFFKQN